MSARSGGRPSGVSIGSPGQGDADADDPYFARIRQVFYNAWLQPSYADAGATPAIVSFQLSANGYVSRPVLKKSSGNPVMDASVMDAVKSVSRVDGLPADFVGRYHIIEITFEVEGEGR